MPVYNMSALDALEKERRLLDELFGVQNQLISTLYEMEDCSDKEETARIAAQIEKLRAREKDIEDDISKIRQKLKRYLLELFK